MTIWAEVRQSGEDSSILLEVDESVRDAIIPWLNNSGFSFTRSGLNKFVIYPKPPIEEGCKNDS